MTISSQESLSRTPISSATTARYGMTVAPIKQVQEFATRWLWTYNNERPNMALVA